MTIIYSKIILLSYIYKLYNKVKILRKKKKQENRKKKYILLTQLLS